MLTNIAIRKSKKISKKSFLIYVLKSFKTTKLRLFIIIIVIIVRIFKISARSNFQGKKDKVKIFSQKLLCNVTQQRIL
jgi:hypothetical protein